MYEKVKHETYNDGYIKYGLIENIRDPKTRVKIGEKLDEKGILPFSYQDIRDGDNITADSLGYTINEKIKVPYREIPNNIKIIINDNQNKIYDVVKKDSPDRKKMYLYLQITKNESEK